ncbi:hypothetical protein ACFPN0_10460 [Kitasatospora cinereorecta]
MHPAAQPSGRPAAPRTESRHIARCGVLRVADHPATPSRDSGTDQVSDQASDPVPGPVPDPGEWRAPGPAPTGADDGPRVGAMPRSPRRHGSERMRSWPTGLVARRRP